MTLTIGSFFTGIMGLDIPFERLGFEMKWCIENELYAKEIIKKRNPKATIYGDIKTVNFKTIYEVDGVTGGFPCQDISNAGNRNGIKGSRSSLWKYMFKGIRILRPGFVLIENVSALLGRGLNVVLADLASIGYDAEWHCVSASAVGAPHRRDRIWITAYPQHTNSNGFRLDRQEIKQQGETELQNEQKCGIKGFREDMVNSNNNGQFTSKEPRGITERINWSKKRKNKSCKFEGSSEQISNTCKTRLQGIKQEERYASRQGWWSSEPRLGRVANGIPNRVDRIKCLGNAVVPQVAEVFAEAIKIKYA